MSLSILDRRARLACTIASCLLLGPGCDGRGSPREKIDLDLDALNAQGLYGPPDGLRSLDYEFCIPNDASAVATVRGIDPTVRIHRDSPGRIGCTSTEYLCIGNTAQRDFRGVLHRLAELPYVERIGQAHFE